MDIMEDMGIMEGMDITEVMGITEVMEDMEDSTDGTDKEIKHTCSSQASAMLTTTKVGILTFMTRCFETTSIRFICDTTKTEVDSSKDKNSSMDTEICA